MNRLFVLFRFVVAALAARISTWMRYAPRGAFGVMDGDAVVAAAGFLAARSGAAVRHRKTRWV
jgi:hypothetical protein